MDQKQFKETSNNCEVNFNSQSRSNVSFLKADFLLLLLFAIFVFIIYSNSIKGPFVFDDTINIRDNPKIRLTKLTFNGIIGAGFESPCQYRPVANISFALNYYFNRYDFAYYHLVNILIHIATGIILFYFFKTTLGLLRIHNLNSLCEKNASLNKRNLLIHKSITSSKLMSQRLIDSTSNGLLFISYLAAFIWLVHPVQTQSVSYIVQRMNCMAAMFYILSLLLYVKARLSNIKKKKLTLYLGCILSGILSLGSKEIAATLPFFIFLYEWYFFQEVSLKWIKRNSIYFLCLLFIIIFLVLLYLGAHPMEKILSAYSHRDFSIGQRVLTEFRVIIYYISLILFPHPMRLNLLHDFPISHSLFDPITTLYSLIAIAGMLVMAIWLAKKERLLSFCILWFLGNLVVESSFIGLEIIFEHRVYLPSMFFILMFVSLIYRFGDSKWIWYVLLCLVGITLSVWTYQRNIVWSDDVSLWGDCVNKSPHKSRQHYNLGVVLASNGNFDDAIEHYLIALKIKPDYLEAYYNLGNALARKGDDKAAIYNYQKVLQINPGYFKVYYNMGQILLKQGEISKAINNYQKVLKINGKMPHALYNLSWIYATSIDRNFRNGIKAVELAEKLCILTEYQQPLAMDALAAAYAETGNFDKAVETAQKALELALQLGPEELVIGLKSRLKLYQSRQPYRQGLKQNKGS
jgi:protein O-mannosyl-transferase